MRKSICIAAALALALTTASSAQRAGDSAPRPTVGVGSKTMTSCTLDIPKYCSTAPKAILKECLVKNWDHISNDCQDALATPAGEDALKGAGLGRDNFNRSKSP
jgi:hypothetical protein